MTIPASMMLAVSALLAVTANANPTGSQVVSGSATLQQTGNLLQITNSPSAIINWQSFAIGANEITRFVQQASTSAVLNRVVAQNPSSILGALQSNGRVFLINPSGILFGAGAQVDVAGLVASTLNLADADFLAGRLRFTEAPGAGAVVNQGAITAAGGGVYLIGPSVTNGGVISNPQGEVVLAAGRSVELVDAGTPSLRVELNAPDNEAVNLGQIIAGSGRIGIFAGLVRHSGALNADRAVSGPAGAIVLKATSNIVTDGSASISAAEGSIRIEAGGSVTLNGTGGIASGGVVVNATGNVSVGPGTSVVTPNGPVVIQTPGNLDVNGFIAGGQLNISSPSISNSTTGSLVVSPGLGSLTVNGVGVAVTTGQVGVVPTNSASIFTSPGPAKLIAADSAALTRAARSFQLSLGQVVGPLMWTSQNSSPTWIMDRLAPRLVPPRRSHLVTE